MKRLILSLAAAAAVVTPLAAASTAAAQSVREERREYRDAQRDYNRTARQYQRGRADRGDLRDARRDVREEYREYRGAQRDRYNDRWDGRRYNGYYYNNRWNYGPPPSAYYNRPGYRPGYSSWRRGGYLPPYYRSYVVNDYYRYGLRQPPRGYYWYNSGNDYILAAIATGLIFDVITR